MSPVTVAVESCEWDFKDSQFKSIADLIVSMSLMMISKSEQESPPAGNHKRHTDHGVSSTPLAILSRGVPRPRSQMRPSLAGGGVPILTCPDGGYPTSGWGGVTYDGVIPLSGTRVQPGKGPGTSYWGTPRKDMGPVEVLWDGDVFPPRWWTD